MFFSDLPVTAVQSASSNSSCVNHVLNSAASVVTSAGRLFLYPVFNLQNIATIASATMGAPLAKCAVVAIFGIAGSCFVWGTVKIGTELASDSFSQASVKKVAIAAAKASVGLCVFCWAGEVNRHI